MSKKHIWLSPETKDKIEQLLALSKDRRYRKGFLQALVSFEIISQEHWKWLKAQIGEPKPTLLLSAFDDPEQLENLKKVTTKILKHLTKTPEHGTSKKPGQTD